MSLHLSGFASVLAFLFLSADGLSATVVLPASRDNTLYESATGALSNGRGEYLFAGRTNQASDSLRRALVLFDLSSIPPGSTVTSASLLLTMSKTISGAHVFELHPITADWGEGISDASGDEGAGAPSQSGDATWIHRFYNTNTWSSPGGDPAATVSASQSVSGTGSYAFGPSAQMTTDVQGWVSGPSTNFGWLVLGGESTAGSAKRFNSRENAAVSTRPVLAVDYVPASSVGTWELY